MMKRKFLVLFISFCVLVSCLFASNQAMAVDNSKKAMEAYRQLLSKKQYQWTEDVNEFSVNTNLTKSLKFYCADINGDGVKELFLQNTVASWAAGYIKVFTFKKGKVRCVLDSHDIQIYKKTNAIKSSESHTGAYYVTYYKLSKKNNLVEKLSCAGTDMKEYANPIKHIEKVSDDFKIYYTSYQVNKKEASYKAYKKKEKELIKYGVKKIKWHKNTKNNRALYLH